jgi:hypothetical protein
MEEDRHISQVLYGGERFYRLLIFVSVYMSLSFFLVISRLLIFCYSWIISFFCTMIGSAFCWSFFAEFGL